ncbi:MAG: FHA domain-containing protein [Planctomycetes bacterium]|jgi:anti-anti-sigma regulatory factor|nr:FHA domain-containing protein [Planctomycetota bacterium]
MKFYLIVAKGRKQGMPIPVSCDLFLVGSDRMCQLRKDSLGAKHCAFVTRDKKVFVRDMDSGKATLVNGAAIPPGEEWPLHKGDRITLGPLEFLVEFREQSLSQADIEEWSNRTLDEQDGQEDDDDDDAEHLSAAGAAQSILNKLNSMKGLVTGQLRIGHEHGVVIVRLNCLKLVEESEIASVKKELCDNLNKPNQRILLDLKNVRRLSSQAVVMLADFYRWLQHPRGSSMAVCRIRSELQTAMGMLRVEKIPIYRDKKTALNSDW